MDVKGDQDVDMEDDKYNSGKDSYNVYPINVLV